MKLRKFLAVVLSIAMVLSSMSFTVLADDPALPNAEVKNLGAITIDEYSIWDGSLSEGGDPIDLQIAMEFIAKDTEEEAVANFYGNYTTDFFIKMEGMANGNFTADGCYLAGNYGTFGWIQIPLDGMLIEEGVIYPVITSVGFDFKYTDICSAVKDFKCGIYLSETVIEENPDLKVNLTLGLSEDIDTAKAGQYTTVDSYTYPVADFNKVVELYRASVMARSGGLVYVDSYESLEEALAAAEDGDTIKVIKSFEVKNQVSVEKDITLDLNGCIINGAMASGSETNHIYALANKAEMIIMDSVGTGSIDSRGIYNYGNLTLESGTINAIDGNGGYAVYNQNGSTFVMNGGVIAATYEDDHQSVNGGYDATALYVPADSTATLNGGKIVNVCDFTFAVYTAGTLNIPDDSTIEIIGTHGAITVQGGTTTIDAGTFTIPADEYVRTDNVIYVSGGSIVINGGTFVGDSDTTSGGSCIYDEAGSATINGGSFSGSSGGDVWGTTGTVITGGSFENLTETQHIADGFKLGENGAIIVDRTGSVTPCYTAPGKYWGEARSNSEESFVIELYEEDTKIASASLNNIGGIIDGDVYVTWHLDFSPVEDSYWNVEWAEGYPKYDMNPTAVKLFADGVEVAENNVQYNAPDNLNKIVALAEGYTGGVVAYTSLVEAVGNFNGRKVNVLRDVTEEIKELNGCTLTTNVEGGVTVTSTYSDYIYAGDFNIGKGVTVKSTKFFTFDDVLNTMGNKCDNSI